MGIVRDLGRVYLRAYQTDGQPATGANKPKKAEGVAAFDKIDELLLSALAAQGGGSLVYSTLAQLTADATDRIQYQKADVIADPTPANNGTYQNTSTTSANTWAKIADPFVLSNLGTNTQPLG